MPIKKFHHQGFTITELLITLSLTVIVLVALIAIFVANVQHYRIVLNTNRLYQQLQSVMNMMVTDIRRAGYWSNASNDLNLDQNNNPFMASGTNISVGSPNSCILLTYDHNKTGTLPSITSSSDDDRYGYRLNGQALQTRPWGATFSCSASANAWENITDVSYMQITALTFTLNTQTVATGPRTAAITLRSVDISITGRLTRDSSVTKTLTAHVRIRNDKFIP